MVDRHPRFRALVASFRIFRVSFWLSKYGARSPKRLKMYSNSRGVRAFRTRALTKRERERLPDRLASHRVNANGKKVWTGKKTLLKNSQTEPYLAVELHMCNICLKITPQYRSSKVLSGWLWEKICPQYEEASRWTQPPTKALRGGLEL